MAPSLWFARARTQIPSFLGVGAIGFIVDALVFFCLTGTGLGHIYARIAASLIALTLTWRLNRRHTFAAGRVDPAATEFLRYLGASALGALANLGVLTLIAPHDAAFHHVPAYLAGAMAGLVVNFLTYDRFVFRGRYVSPAPLPPQPEHHP